MSNVKLNKDFPHGEVYGDQVACYYQLGKYFTGQGELCEADAHGVFSVVPEEDAPAGEAPVDTGLAGLHWSKLKTMVVKAGGTWSSKTAAVEFLTAVAAAESGDDDAYGDSSKED